MYVFGCRLSLFRLLDIIIIIIIIIIICVRQNISGTLLKEQGSSNLVQNMGHKWPVLRPRCIGPGRARTQKAFNSKIHTYPL